MLLAWKLPSFLVYTGRLASRAMHQRLNDSEDNMMGKPAKVRIYIPSLYSSIKQLVVQKAIIAFYPVSGTKPKKYECKDFPFGFNCTDGELCLSADQRCNDRVDCSDLSDENKTLCCKYRLFMQYVIRASPICENFTGCNHQLLMGSKYSRSLQ